MSKAILNTEWDNESDAVEYFSFDYISIVNFT